MLLKLLLLAGSFKLLCKATSSRCRDNVCLKNKVVLVLGGYNGSSYYLSRNLASRGAKVIIASKTDKPKIREALINETSNPNIHHRTLNVLSFKSVRDFVSNFKREENRLDILLNNMRIGFRDRRITEDGLIEVMQSNYFSPFLLTALLSDMLIDTPKARVVNLSSILSFCHSIKTPDMIKETPEIVKNECVQNIIDYANAKALVLIANTYFAKKLQAYDVTCNSVFTGLPQAGLFKMDQSSAGLLTPVRSGFVVFSKLFGQNDDELCQTLLHVSISRKLHLKSGINFLDCIHFIQPGISQDRAFCDRVIKISEEIVGL